MKTIKSVNDAKAAGLDTSRYFEINGQYWLLACDAALLISYINDHNVDVKYLNNPVKQGRLHPREMHDRCNLYPFDELIKIEVKAAGRPKLADDKVTASALRQRVFKERRRLAQGSSA